MSGDYFFKAQELKQQNKLHTTDHSPYRIKEDKQDCTGLKKKRQWSIPLLPSEKWSKTEISLHK